MKFQYSYSLCFHDTGEMVTGKAIDRAELAKAIDRLFLTHRLYTAKAWTITVNDATGVCRRINPYEIPQTKPEILQAKPEILVEETEEPEILVEETEEPEILVEEMEKPEILVEETEEPEILVDS